MLIYLKDISKDNKTERKYKKISYKTEKPLNKIGNVSFDSSLQTPKFKDKNFFANSESKTINKSNKKVKNNKKEFFFFNKKLINL